VGKVISGISAFLFLLMLFGCGATNLNTALNPAQRFSITSGNWNLSASSSTRPQGQFLLGGHLEQNGDAITGILHVASSRCFKVDKDVPVSGTIEDGSAVVTSLPIDGQTLHATLIGHGVSVVGNYAFEGGCSNGDEGSLTGNLVPSVSGMWNAIDSQPDKAVSGVNLALAQSDNVNGHGVYPLSGTFTFIGSSCQVSGRITSGYVAGNIVVINSETQEATGETGAFRMEGDTTLSHTPSITGAYSYTAGVCKDRAGVLTFTP
jgi:hypothetical protein